MCSDRDEIIITFVFVVPLGENKSESSNMVFVLEYLFFYWVNSFWPKTVFEVEVSDQIVGEYEAFMINQMEASFVVYILARARLLCSRIRY